MSKSPVPTAKGLERLVEALRVLPGVGPRSAQRMAYHLLQNDRAGAGELVQALGGALESVRRCARCHNFTEDEVCSLCRSGRRDASVLCVVETPADLATVEQTLSYSGLYFVLMGRLSPLDGIGPRDIGLDRLQARLGGDDFAVLPISLDRTGPDKPRAFLASNGLSRNVRSGSVQAPRRATGTTVMSPASALCSQAPS